MQVVCIDIKHICYDEGVKDNFMTAESAINKNDHETVVDQSSDVSVNIKSVVVNSQSCRCDKGIPINVTQKLELG